MTDPRPFADVLAEHSGGRIADDLAHALRDLVEAVATTGRKGALAVTLTVAPTDLGPDAVTVTVKIAGRPPLPLYADALYFVDANANLRNRDPRQTILPIDAEADDRG